MKFIDPHIHMHARTTDDRARMAAAGIVAVIVPAFWLGQPRTSVGRYIDCVSDPLAVPRTAQLMLARGIPVDHVEAVCCGNALAAYAQSGQMQAADWEAPIPVDQRTLFEGNSVLRGQVPQEGAAGASGAPLGELAFK